MCIPCQARSSRPIDSSSAHSANHLFGSPPFWSIFRQTVSAVASPETTLSEKVSYLLSSTTLRQVLKREPVSSVSIQQVRRSSVAASLSAVGSSLSARLSESSRTEPSVPKSLLSRTACLPGFDVTSFSKIRPRSSPTSRLKLWSPITCNTEEAKSSSRGSRNTQRVSGGTPPGRSRRAVLQSPLLRSVRRDRSHVGRTTGDLLRPKRNVPALAYDSQPRADPVLQPGYERVVRPWASIGIDRNCPQERHHRHHKSHSVLPTRVPQSLQP